ncbi:hypothetical protein WN71_034510 [Streptomyces mangrovisoli]|uniref:Uncharacterized protein n=1 Tax=Streptomyces mangrovisoli TaxID=1428628 RepID=A0A1J4NM39_9ACTN|nr:hypothetical protein WN71_034510 [Streptomyces mangrovisoli]
MRILTDASSRESASRVVAASSRRLGRRAYPPLAGRGLLAEQAQPFELLVGVGDRSGVRVDHRAAVVHPVLEDGPGEHEPVDMGDGHADGHAAREAAAGDRPVDVQPPLVAAVDGGDDERTPLDHHPQVADEPGVQHGVEVGPLKTALLAQTPMPGELGDGKPLGCHDRQSTDIDRPRPQRWRSSP